MPSCPQFSLRMLLFVMLIVCLAAAALTRLQSEPKSMDFEDLTIAVQVQSLFRLALCVAFPAMFAAGALARGGIVRSFCIGAIFPAVIPLVQATLHIFFTEGDPFFSIEEVDYVIMHLVEASSPYETRVGALWFLMPFIGLICMLSVWVLQVSRDRGPVFRASLVVGLPSIAAVCASITMIKLPASGASAGVMHELPIRFALCLTLPAVLFAAAIHSDRKLRAFCAGAVFPAGLPNLVMYRMEGGLGRTVGRWESQFIFLYRHFVVALWALAIVSGLICVFFYWLFQRAEKDQRE